MNPLADRAAELVRRWHAAGGDEATLPADVAASLPTVFGASGFVADCATRDVALIASLASSGELGRPRRDGEAAALATGLAAQEADEPAFMDALRRLRRRELVRIAWRDLTGAAPEEPARREVRARTIRGDVTRGELALGWRTVPPLHPDSCAAPWTATARKTVGRAQASA